MEFLFWRFVDTNSAHIHDMQHEYQPLLIFLSILNAIFASYVAFTVVDRLKTVTSSKQKMWLLSIGALSMGFGVWSMHFTAMQACDMGIDVSYDLTLTLLSILPAIAGSYVALRSMSKTKRVSWWVLQRNALFMALGIGTMHYMGMEAIRAKAFMGYDLPLFLGSLVAAHVLATISLYTKDLRHIGKSKSYLVKNAYASVIMGAAVSSMHYIAMGAVHFFPDSNVQLPEGVLTISPILFGSLLFVAVLVLLTAVTISILVEKVFSDSKILMEAIFSVTHEALLAVDRQGHVHSLNASAKKMIGSARFQDIDLDKVFVDGVPLSRWFDNVITGGATIVHRDTTLEAFNQTIPAEVVLAKVTVDTEEILLLMIRDLSDLKTAEITLNQHSKMATLGKMTSGLAHEINTPLGTIVMRSSQLQRLIDRGGVDQDKLLEFIKAIHQAANHIGSIIKGLRSFSRSGEQDPFEKESVQTIVEEAVSLCEASIERHGVELLVSGESEPLSVECRKTQICQILMNLIQNAQDAILSADCTVKRITVGFESNAEVVKLSVKDSGPGIPDALRKSILEPFFTTKGIGKGTGLGLSISRGIAEAHGGSLYLDTDTKETCFVIELPRFQNKGERAA